MSEWQEVRLGDVLDKIVGGGTPSKENPSYWDGGDIFWCSVKDMSDDKFRILQTKDTITLDGLNNSSANLIPKGTVITATRMGLGRAFINETDMAINQDLKALIPNSNINNKYLLWTIILYRNYIEMLGNGATVKGIRLETLKNIKINLPPLPTQQKIAKILSNYDDLIENNLKRIKLLEESARLTYEEWFLRFRIDGKKLDIDPDTNLPFGWKKNKLVSLCENFTDGTHDSPKQVDGVDSYYLITGKHLASNQIDFSTAYKISESDFLKISKRSGLRRNDILFSNIGTLGHVAMVGKFIEFSCKNVFIFRPLKDVNCYLFEFLKYEQNKNNFIAQSSGSTQKFTSLQFMRSFETALAPVTILHEFNKVVSGMYAQIDNLQDQNKLLKEARDILLPRLMTGMIDTDDMDIAV